MENEWVRRYCLCLSAIFIAYFQSSVLFSLDDPITEGQSSDIPTRDHGAIIESKIERASWNLTNRQYPNIIQVIRTRFMQNQGNLSALGMARLNLFQIVTLPSLLQQSNPDFIWVIRTDPELHTAIRTSLIESVSKHENIFVVASNSNPEGFKGPNGIVGLSNEST